MKLIQFIVRLGVPIAAFMAIGVGIDELGQPPAGVQLAASDRHLIEVVASSDASEHPQPLRPARMFTLPLGL